MLQLARMTKVLRESRDAQFLSFFNKEAVEEMLGQYNQICETVEKEKMSLIDEQKKPMKQKFKTSYLICLTTILKRMFRILLAYFNFRLTRIRREYWKTLSNIPNDQLLLMDSTEKTFYREYDKMVKGSLLVFVMIRLPRFAANRIGFAARYGAAQKFVYRNYCVGGCGDYYY